MRQPPAPFNTYGRVEVRPFAIDQPPSMDVAQKDKALKMVVRDTCNTECDLPLSIAEARVMEAEEDRNILLKAKELLSELYADLQTAPLELLPLIDGFGPRLEEAIERFRERRISERELAAHTLQIRLSYLQDLTRLLAAGPRPVG